MAVDYPDPIKEKNVEYGLAVKSNLNAYQLVDEAIRDGWACQNFMGWRAFWHSLWNTDSFRQRSKQVRKKTLKTLHGLNWEHRFGDSDPEKNQVDQLINFLIYERLLRMW